jgi:two-component system chemotaxis response regulator CheB
LSFSLDASEEVNYSRPSIDVSFESFLCLKRDCCGIIRCKSRWGKGFKMIAENGGESIVQDCDEAEFSVMPRSAIEIYKNHKVYTLNHIIKK